MNLSAIGVQLVLVVGLLGSLASPSMAAEPPRVAYRQGVLIELNGVISPLLERFLDRQLERARQLDADLVILEIDSPGGYLDSTLKMAERLRDIDWAHTAAYIPREALSGAAIIALGCDEILMGENARLGDAGPVFQGPDAQFRHAPEKIRSNLARHVRDLATAKGRPPALAEAMIDMDLVVYRMTNTETGQVTFLSEPEIEALDEPAEWERGKPVLESREGKFLEVNGTRAVELQLASAVIPDRQALQAHFQLPEPPIVLRYTAVDTAVWVLNLPLVTGLLFVIGLVALYFELSAPGISIGGLTAGLCFSLFFWSRFLGGTAGWLEVILFLAGLAFLGIEIFVIPGFGISGIAGFLLLIGSLILASQNHLLPESPRALAHLGRSALVVLGSLGVFMVAAAVLTRFYGSLPVFNRLILRTPAPDEDESPADEYGKPLPPDEGALVQVGDWGVAESPLRPAGKVLFGEEYMDVVTEGSFVEPGQQVRVVRVQGNRIVVRAIS